MKTVISTIAGASFLIILSLLSHNFSSYEILVLSLLGAIETATLLNLF